MCVHACVCACERHCLRASAPVFKDGMIAARSDGWMD